MPVLSQELENELRGMAHRITRTPSHGVCGVVQFTGSDDDMGFYLDATTASVEVRQGRHPSADVEVTAPTRTFLNMFQGRFAFFDPAALSQLGIDGAVEMLLPLFSFVADSDQKLGPFERAAQTRRRQPPVERVPRVARATEDDILEAMAESMPLLITDAVRSWPWLAKSLTPESLVSLFGDQQLTAAGETQFVEPESAESFLRRCHDDAAAATAGLVPRTIRDAIGHPGYFRPQDYRWPFFFMGATGAVSPVHRDLAHNLAVHVFGVKRWRLFGPDQAEFLYPNIGPEDGPSAQTCLVDVELPDLDRFPLYQHANPVDVVVRAGEILFVPSGWFHHVNVLELSLNIAYSLKWKPGHPGEITADRPLLDITAGEDDD